MWEGVQGPRRRRAEHLARGRADCVGRVVPPGAPSPRPRGQEQTARRLRAFPVGPAPRLGEVRRAPGPTRGPEAEAQAARWWTWAASPGEWETALHSSGSSERGGEPAGTRSRGKPPARGEWRSRELVPPPLLQTQELPSLEAIGVAHLMCGPTTPQRTRIN